jgi:hypothetical protein
MRSAPALSLDIAASRIARRCFAVVAALALLSVWVAGMSVPIQVALTALLLAVCGFAWRSLHEIEVRRAVLQSDGIWLLSTQQREVAAQLLSSSVLGGLVGLCWRDIATQRLTSALLWPDMLSEGQMRPLRVWLLSGRAHSIETTPPESPGPRGVAG